MALAVQTVISAFWGIVCNTRKVWDSHIYAGASRFVFSMYTFQSEWEIHRVNAIKWLRWPLW